MGPQLFKLESGINYSQFNLYDPIVNKSIVQSSIWGWFEILTPCMEFQINYLKTSLSTGTPDTFPE